MSYLFKIDSGFELVDYKSRQGIFYQFYTKDGFSRPTTLLATASSLYSADLDNAHTLHVVALNSKHQIVYISVCNAQINRQVILDDPRQTYDFKDLHIFELGGTLYFFYTVKNPTGTTRSLVFQTLDTTPSTPQTLLPSIFDHACVKLIKVNHQLHIFYTDFDTNYTLNHFIFNTSESQQLLTSPIPIINYSLCLIAHEMHLVIQKDAYGQHQLSYFDVRQALELPLECTSTFDNPCLLSYCGFLWISYLASDGLYIILANPQTHQFSIPIKSSLQNHLNCSTYRDSHSDSPLLATQLYAQIYHTLRLPIIAAFDTTGIHPDLSMATELDLMLDALNRSTPYSSPPTPLTITPSPLSSNPPSTPLTHVPFNDIPSPEPLTTSSPKQSLKSATQSFMDSSVTFELLPRDTSTP